MSHRAQANRKVRGTVTQNGRTQTVILRRVELSAEDPYISRAQFDSAMILFHRY